MKQVRVVIAGRVQGVGFRYWTQDEAHRRGLDGWVRNLVNGRVEACFQGDPDKVDDMLLACHEGPRFASVLRVEIFDSEAQLKPGFQILPTGG